MKQEGFRIKFVNGLWLGIQLIGAFIAVILLWAIIAVLYLPEVLIALIIALIRDKWRMWLYPLLRKTTEAILEASP